MTYRIEVIDRNTPGKATYFVNADLECAKAVAKGLMRAHGLVGADIYGEADPKIWSVTGVWHSETTFGYRPDGSWFVARW